MRHRAAGQRSAPYHHGAPAPCLPPTEITSTNGVAHYPSRVQAKYKTALTCSRDRPSTGGIGYNVQADFKFNQRLPGGHQYAAFSLNALT